MKFCFACGVFTILLLMPLLSSLSATAQSADWPMWRYDAARSAASPANLAKTLQPIWSREYGPREQVWDDPLNHDLMPYDKVFEPVVAAGRMFLGFNDRDKLVALDVETGHELWTFFADGPVRLPPVVWKENVYFASDDGYLYCLDVEDGTQKWRFRGGPSARKVLGNRRVISAWPARGGPVMRDGVVYFAAGIWPFMGTFLYALDGESGDLAWANDRTGADYILQPHHAPSFGGVAPQGALVAADELLLVPGGRSVPAAFDRRTGQLKYFHLDAGGKGTGGSLVIAGQSEFYVHSRYRGVQAFRLRDGGKIDFTLNEPVVTDRSLYSAGQDDSGPVVVAIDVADHKTQWKISADASGDLIRAGDRLYAAGKKNLAAIELPRGDSHSPTLAWSMPIEGEILRLLAADGKLFAVTLDGRILAFGNRPNGSKPLVHALQASKKQTLEEPLPEKRLETKLLLEDAGTDEGHALMFGLDDGRLLESLAIESRLHLVAIDPDAEKVTRLRRHFDAIGLYGRRVAIHQGDPASFDAPPYIANLIVVGQKVSTKIDKVDTLAKIYQSVRPYGGLLWFDTRADKPLRLLRLAAEADLPGAEVTSTADHLTIRRQGPLEGAGQWTHQYGNVANTIKSDDVRVQLPLGVLWFGGNSNQDILPRHGHGPPEQVTGGRLFIEGMNCLAAWDVYTGRVLWKVEFENMGTLGVYFDDSYTDTPLSTARNQKHIPGATARGANFVAAPDAVYVVLGDACRVLDPATGETLREIPLPRENPQNDNHRTEREAWGYVGVYEDLLLGGAGMGNFGQRSAESTDPAKSEPPTIEDLSASRGLVVFDRHTGRMLWKAKARFSFLHNGIVAGGGRIYCLDRLSPGVEKKFSRRGQARSANYRIVAFDAQTGKTLWQTEDDIFGTWLGYAEKHDVLLQAGAKASDRLSTEVDRGMATYRGRDGEVRWKNLDVQYSGPCILHHESIITNADQHSDVRTRGSRAYSLLDGSPQAIVNPITRRPEPWQMVRGKGCGTVVASENLLLMRDGAAGYFDLKRPAGIGHWGGFKPGCTSNLIAADGVLNAPEYTRTCTCSYQNQTSLALVPMPDVELWTISRSAETPANGRIQRLGVNFGAPGDRFDNGTLWLEYPARPNTPPQRFAIDVQPEGLEYFRRHASKVQGPGPAWIGASGLRNLESVTIQMASRTQAEAEAQSAEETPPTRHTVRLYFAEPDGLAPGQRIFDVILQGEKILEQFDVAQAAGGPDRCVMREFSDIPIDEVFRLEMTASTGPDAERDTKLDAGPILSGIEIIAR